MTLRLQLISDLHVEFMPDEAMVRHVCSSLLSDADVLCIAGDLGVLQFLGNPSPKVELALSLFCNHYPRVLMVTGNHDYYHSGFDPVRRYLRSLNQRFSPVLSTTEEGTIWEVKGVRILACTLWFNHRLSNILYWRGMSDSSLIDGGGAVALARIERRGKRAAEFLQENARPGDILLTHHLPHQQAIDPGFAGNLLNAFFVNDLVQNLLESSVFPVALFGHTHTSMDRRVVPDHVASSPGIQVPWGKVHPSATGTRLVCNPFGYSGRSPNPRFNPRLILDIPT